MKSGVYILIKDFDVIYIGTSIDMAHRIKTHEIKDFDHYVLIPSCNGWRSWIERYLIFLIKPNLNKMSKHMRRLNYEIEHHHLI